jgi:crossover junction endodeoxyribonuclease RuvC
MGDRTSSPRARLPLVVLGVDPGTLVTGYGLVTRAAGGTCSLLTEGTIHNHPSRPFPERLRCIFDALATLIARYRPDEFAIESSYYGKNAQSALKLGQARGVSILAAALSEIPVSEYSPREVKQSVVGNGAASKQQVQYMVRSILRMDRRPMQLDASDAIAVALCHLQRSGMAARGTKTWKDFVTAHPGRVLS